MLEWNEVLMRLGTAAVFGALVGMERERLNWAAGLRTHMLVCVGSCLMMLVSSFGFFEVLGHSNVKLDASRVAAQVVSGIGFIGAGTIMFQKKGVVRGLTTAAGIWTVAGVGLAIGGGMYLTATTALVLVLVVLWGLHPVEKLITKKNFPGEIKVAFNSGYENFDSIYELMEAENLHIRNFKMNKKKTSDVYTIKLEKITLDKLNEITEKLRLNPEVKKVSWHQFKT